MNIGGSGDKIKCRVWMDGWTKKDIIGFDEMSNSVHARLSSMSHSWASSMMIDGYNEPNSPAPT